MVTLPSDCIREGGRGIARHFCVQEGEKGMYGYFLYIWMGMVTQKFLCMREMGTL